MTNEQIARLNSHVQAGMVRAIRHPSLPITLYNYSRECQYSKAWDDVTIQCRGLVLDDSGKVVARPLKKFFNDTEHDVADIPWNMPCEITEKIDGSLLILFWYGGDWRVCTRGSFTSAQSRMGEAIIQASGWIPHLHAISHTFCFELIHPDNRIVIDYKNRRDVVLLAVIDTLTGHETPASLFGGWIPVVRSLPHGTPPNRLREIIRDDEEGYVVRFENGFRVKVKGERYMELHRILSGVSSRMVWDVLSSEGSFCEVLPLLDEETRAWVLSEADSMRAKFLEIQSRVQAVVESVTALATRKEQAEEILEKCGNIASVAFSMMDGKNWRKVLWDRLYPEHRKPTSASRIDEV